MAKLTGRQKSESKRKIKISDPSVCYFCRSTGISQKEKKCPNCSFPQNEGQTAMKRFLWSVNNRHILLKEYSEAIDNAKYTLLGISLLCLAMTLLVLSSEDNVLKLGTILASITYFIIWHWSKKETYKAIITGFIVFIFLLILTGIIDPKTIAAGAYGKFLILGALYYGFRSVKKGRVLYAELESIKKAVDLNIKNEETVNEYL
jgi:hypothetical protein